MGTLPPLADRVRQLLVRHRGIREQKMFGGIAFLQHGNMCCGVIKDRLVVRVGPQQYDACLSRSHVRPMDFTGRPMRGIIYVLPAGYRRADALRFWLEAGLAYTRSRPRKPARPA